MRRAILVVIFLSVLSVPVAFDQTSQVQSLYGFSWGQKRVAVYIQDLNQLSTHSRLEPIAHVNPIDVGRQVNNALRSGGNWLHVTDSHYPGDTFSFDVYCENTGQKILYGVVVQSSDPWLNVHQQSLGTINPGIRAHATFTGQVPIDQYPGTHGILFQCVDSSGAVVSTFSLSLDIVARPQTTTTTAPPPPPPPPPPGGTSPGGVPICELVSDPRCQGSHGEPGGSGYLCNPSIDSTWSDLVCQDYYQKAGYIQNPFGGYCIIATAAYGSPMAPEVVYMRTVRDRMIGPTPTGRVLRDIFNAWYYSWSPPVAGWISGSESLRAVFRVLLIPIVLIVHVTAFIFKGFGGGDLGAVTGFFVAAFLSIGTYVLLPAIVLIWTLTYLRRRMSMKRSSRSLKPNP